MASRKKGARFEFVHNREQRTVRTLDETWGGWLGEPDEQFADQLGRGLFKLRPPPGIDPERVKQIRELLEQHGASAVIVDHRREDAHLPAQEVQVMAEPEAPRAAAVRLVDEVRSVDRAELHAVVERHLVDVGL